MQYFILREKKEKTNQKRLFLNVSQGKNCTHIFIIYICLKQNYIKQYKSFRFLKMWYDDSTARLDRFSHIALKQTLGLQNLCSFFRIALFDGEIYPLEHRFQKGEQSHP